MTIAAARPLTTPASPATPPAAPAPQDTKTITRTYEVAVFTREHLGNIPDDHYEWVWFPWGDLGWGHSEYHSCNGNKCNAGPVGVYRDVPVYESDGKVKMRKVTETLTEDSYDPKNRALVYGALGAAAGVGAGALGGMLAGSGAGPLGMIAGGVLGAAAGAFLGKRTAEGDKVEEVWVKEPVHHPDMHGYTHRTEPDYTYETHCETRHRSDGTTDRDCHSVRRLRGYWHRYEPEVTWRRVGEYDRPTLQHTNPVGPIAGGALAVGAGGLAGLAVGALAALL